MIAYRVRIHRGEKTKWFQCTARNPDDATYRLWCRGIYHPDTDRIDAIVPVKPVALLE
ncbi:MAG: hypothetical protein AAF958_14195 [Planctomycetota bacterium]